MRKTMLLALAMSAVALLAACSSNNTSALTGRIWLLTAITEKVPAFQGVVPPEDQSKYTITFNTDDTFNSRRRTATTSPVPTRPSDPVP